MRSFIISIILFCSSGFCIAQEIHPIKSDGSCDDQNYKLSLFKTNDALFSASHCITIHHEEIDEINGIDGIEEIIHNSILVAVIVISKVPKTVPTLVIRIDTP